MSKNFELKKEQVKDIKARIEKSLSVVFVDYRGITVADDTEMRSALRQAGCDYMVCKNRLMKIALDDLKINCLDDKLEGTLAVAFSYNSEIDAAKALKKFADNSKVTFKFGLLGSNFMDEAELKALAELPSKEILVAKLLSILNAPATGLVSVLNGPIRSLAYALNAIASKN